MIPLEDEGCLSSFKFFSVVAIFPLCVFFVRLFLYGLCTR